MKTSERGFGRFKFIALGGLAVLILAFSAGQPDDLPGPPALPEDSVNDPSQDKIACGNLIDEIESFQELHYENGDAIAGFIERLVTRMWDWMKIFNQLEGKTVTFKEEYFAPVRDTAEISEEIKNMIYDNTEQLDQRLTRIKESVALCL